MSRKLTFRFPKQISARAFYIKQAAGVLVLLVSIGMVLLNAQTARGLTPTLPGQQIWQNGISSYLFGTNEVAWDPMALSNPAIMTAVKAAGIPLIRVPLTASDADQRVSLVEQSGAQCLGILSWHNPADAVKVVQMLGNRCQLYEFGNEPDSLSNYITTWNATIGALRQANPNAKFIGPVLASPDAQGIQTFLSAVKNNPPDVVSWHMYPCTNQTLQSCQAGNHINFSKHTQEIGAVIQSVLGHEVPQAITEYNFDWQDGKTPNHDSATMQQFMTQTLNDLIQATQYGLVMANEYDLGGRAGAGTLDMVDPSSGAPLAQFTVLSQFIAQYRAGAPAPATATSAATGTPCIDNTQGSTNDATATSSPTDTATTVTATTTSTPGILPTPGYWPAPASASTPESTQTTDASTTATTGTTPTVSIDNGQPIIQCVPVVPPLPQTPTVTDTTTPSPTPGDTPTATSTQDSGV
jgi:hypothetical protein